MNPELGRSQYARCRCCICPIRLSRRDVVETRKPNSPTMEYGDC